MNAVLSSVLGKVIDRDFVATKTITQSLRQVGGIQFSVGCAIIILATFIPKGALALNPKSINTHLELHGDEDESVLDGAVLKQGGDTSIDAEKAAARDSDEEKPVYNRQ
jgi:hypothetical protein